MDFYRTHLAGEKTGCKQIIHENIEGILAGSFDAGISLGAETNCCRITWTWCSANRRH